MTAASNSESRKRHEEAALTLRDIGRANGHGDPVPGMCPECGEAATADEIEQEADRG